MVLCAMCRLFINGKNRKELKIDLTLPVSLPCTSPDLHYFRGEKDRIAFRYEEPPVVDFGSDMGHIDGTGRLSDSRSFLQTATFPGGTQWSA